MQRRAGEADSTLTPRQRLLLAGVGLLILGLLALARGLSPSPAGFGTHEQLGLAPCWIYQRTGVICPSCGMTTAWAHLVRGNISTAVSSNLGGALAAAAAISMAPWLLASAAKGRWLMVRPTINWILAAASLWLVIVALDWARRILLR